MDTAGDVSFSAFEKINPYIDRYFFDLKASNSYDYRKIIGGNFDRIISNMKRLIYLGKRTHIRIPLIPNFNTSDEYIDSMCELIGKTGASQVELLPFHRLGCGKYTALGIDYPYRNCPPLTADETAAIASKYKRYFSVKTEA